MTTPTNNSIREISYDHNDKPVYPKPITPEQKKVMKIVESSLCSSGEISRPLRSSATDLIALPKGANSDEDMEGETPVSQR